MSAVSHRDCYPTPPGVCRIAGNFLDALNVQGPYLDPFAGEGAHVRFTFEDRREWAALEMRESCRDALVATGASVGICDSLRTPWPAKHVVITNPPFSRMVDVVRRVLDYTRTSGKPALVYQIQQWAWDSDRTNWALSRGLVVGRVRHVPGSGDSRVYAYRLYSQGECCRIGAGVLETPHAHVTGYPPAWDAEHEAMGRRVLEMILAEGRAQHALALPGRTDEALL